MDVALQISALVLSLVATIVTAVGFFASLRYYRSGVELQTDAQNLLSRVDEKISAIQSQLGGMLDKTLDAAIGQRRVSPQDAADAQAKLLRQIAEEGTGEETEDETENLAQEVLDYFHLQGLNFTDVSTEEARAIYSLGAQHGFNLFDSKDQLVFVGYFHRDDTRKTAARLKFLLDNIKAAYEGIRLAKNEVRKRGKQLLDMIRVVVLVPEDSDTARLRAAIGNFQPDVRDVDIAMMRPSELRARLEEMYDEVWPNDGNAHPVG